MFEFSIEEIAEKEVKNEGSFLQTPFWTSFKSRHGWKKFTFNVKVQYPEDKSIFLDCDESQYPKKLLENFQLTVLNRSFCKNFFSLSYIPLFPSFPYEKNDFLKEQTIEFGHFLSDFSKALKNYLPKNSIFIRFDPDIAFSEIDERNTFNYGLSIINFGDRLHLYKSKTDIQPPDSTQISLIESEDEIMNRMHSKWRYNIRLSAKKGVEIEKYSLSSEELLSKIDKFYELTKETNKRDGNSSHSKEYYLDLIKSSWEKIKNGEDCPLVNLYIAKHEGDEIASIMTLFSKSESIYLYGASSNLKRNLMPNHLLQWTAIQDAKAYGSKYYDMYGLPPQGDDENHPMHGLYLFKSNFGGQMIHRIGSWDYSNSFFYKPYRFVESLRSFWFKKVIKKIKGR